MKFKFPKIRFLKKVELPKIKLPSEIVAMLLVFLLMSLAFLPSLEITPPNKMTAAKFTKQCSKAGYTIEDVTASYHPDFYAEVFTHTEDDYTISYYTLSHRAYAKALYTHFLSYIQTGARTEKYTYTSDYNRFFTSTDEGLTFMYRNHETIIYISGDPPHDAIFDELIQELNI